MAEVEPYHVELALDLEGDGEPGLQLVERYAAESASSVAEFYRDLLGPEAGVEIEEGDGETVVTVTDDEGLQVAASVAVGLVERAGGAEHLRAALALADDRERRPGVY